MKIRKLSLIIFSSTLLYLIFSVGLITLMRTNSPEIEAPENPPGTLAILFVGFKRADLFLPFFLISLIHTWISTKFITAQIFSYTKYEFIINSIGLTIILLLLYLVYLYFMTSGIKKGINTLLWESGKSDAYVTCIVYFLFSLPVMYWVNKKSEDLI